MTRQKRRYTRSAGKETPRPLAVDRAWMEEMLVEELRTRCCDPHSLTGWTGIPAAATCENRHPLTS